MQASGKSSFSGSFLSKPAIIVYTLLMNDRSGSKVSKSLYLQKTAYNYLCEAGVECLLNYDVLRREERNLTVLLAEIEKWADEAYQLFRSYSLHYLHVLFEGYDMNLGIIHKAHPEPWRYGREILLCKIVEAAAAADEDSQRVDAATSFISC